MSNEELVATVSEALSRKGVQLPNYTAKVAVEAVEQHRASRRGTGPSAIERLEATPEGRAALNTARAELAAMHELREQMIQAVLVLLVKGYSDARHDSYEDGVNLAAAAVEEVWEGYWNG
jgi:hypothetical protein